MENSVSDDASLVIAHKESQPFVVSGIQPAFTLQVNHQVVSLQFLRNRLDHLGVGKVGYVENEIAVREGLHLVFLALRFSHLTPDFLRR